MQIIIMGAPGTGKGTQATLLCEHFQIPHISTGDMLRSQIREGTGLGKKADAIIARGDLISDDIIMAMVEERLSEKDTANGFLLDGFPRTVPQAVGLGASLEKLGRELSAIVSITLAHEMILLRLTARRTCNQCAAVYNLMLSPPQEAGVCDRCGSSDLVQREDDKPDTVMERLKVYDQYSLPLVAYYGASGLLKEIAGEGSVEEVYNRILKSLNTSGKT